jgi:amylosucrase
MVGQDVQLAATRSLQRFMPRLRLALMGELQIDAAQWAVFEARVGHEWPRLFSLLLGLYGSRHDFYWHLEQVLVTMARSWAARSAELHQLDLTRERQPHWYLGADQVGAVLYVDLFAGNLHGVRDRLPYLRELGVTYLHLMPLFAVPAEQNDGGYAVSSYRDVRPDLGTMQELRELAAELRRQGVSLVLDFVFNHTSDEHSWARRAQAGDEEFREFYLIYPDRTMPDQYDATLREIFPSVRRGSFTWDDRVDGWVWTTFNSFQWDLNYANPAVFTAMAAEMLFLANAGIEVLRLDAVAFIWKRLGTDCENLPEAHQLIQAFNAVARIAAPALLFKSEAIVHPDEVVRYISPQEAQLSYNPLLMALCWEALATRETRLISRSLATRSRIAGGCSWVNYLRCHDDIGWTFDDDDARAVGIDPYGHRRFLNDFYTGAFAGSFARGVPFQANPVTGDARVSGTLASLAGLESALESAAPAEIERALARILLLHAVMLSAAGLPLLYLNDERGALNDYGYGRDPHRADDSRWVHRLSTDWSAQAAYLRAGSPEQRLFSAVRRLIQLRTSESALNGAALEIFDTGNPHLLGYVRTHGAARLLVVANFSEYPQMISANTLRLHGLAYRFRDRISDTLVELQGRLQLAGYQVYWLTAD